MPFNGSGVFTLAQPPFAPNTTVASAPMNSDLSDIATGLSGVVTRNGQSPWTANLPAGGYKITGLANGSAATDSTALGQVALRLIERQTPSGAPAYLEFALPTGYTVFAFDFEGVCGLADATPLAQLSNDGGSNWLTSGTDYAWGWCGSLSPGFTAPANSSYMALGFAALGNSAGFSGRLMLTPASSASHGTFYTSTASVLGLTSAVLGGVYSGACGNTTRPNRIRFAFNLTNFVNRGQVILSGVPTA